MKKPLFIAAFSLFVGVLGMTAVVQAQVTASPSYAVYPGQSYCPTLSYNLYRGMSDRTTAGQVSALQYYLGQYFTYEPVPVTGYFGPITANFVARFQREQGVRPVTGGAGPLTRAAIQRACGGTVTPPASGTFYLNTPFTLMQGQMVKQYQGQLDFTLSRINTSPYTLYTYPSYQPATSATVMLGQSCPPGLYCLTGQGATLWYPQQTLELTLGQAVTWQGYTITLNALTPTTATFTVTQGTSGQSATVSVGSPQQGQAYTYGQQVPILWTTTNAPANSSTVVDLYTTQGSKVGTIAIQSNTAGSGSYTWTVPTPNTVCTMQYPNGLCGQNLSGQYFVKVSIVSGSGFDSGATTYASANSGTVTINSSTQQGATFSAWPTSGFAPLATTFTVVAPAGQYKVEFGDGQSQQINIPAIMCITTPCNPPAQTISHTYYGRGTYQAQLVTDAACFYTTPRCMMAVQALGTATVTVY